MVGVSDITFQSVIISSAGYSKLGIPTHPFVWRAPRLSVEIPDRNRAGTQTFVSTTINIERMVLYIGEFLFTCYDFYCLLK